MYTDIRELTDANLDIDIRELTDAIEKLKEILEDAKSQNAHQSIIIAHFNNIQNLENVLFRLEKKLGV